MISDSFMMRSSSLSILTSVPDHLQNNTLSPAFTPIVWLAVLAAGACCDDLAGLGLLSRRIGDNDPALGFLLFLEPLDHDAVVQGSEFHEFCSCRMNAPRLALTQKEC